jgi:hypothetical protein
VAKEVIALAVAPGDAEAVKGDNVARRVGGNGAQHHHRHALALQIVDRRLLYRVADVLDQQAFIQPFQRLREQRQQTRRGFRPARKSPDQRGWMSDWRGFARQSSGDS